MFYHITQKDNVPDILLQGLIPQIGDNCFLVDEECNMVYLSDKISLPYWYILIGDKNPVILEIDINESELCSRQYNMYAEYQCADRIPPECIKIAPNSLLQDIQNMITKPMRHLCIGYLYQLCRIAFKFIQHYYNNGDDMSLYTTVMYAENSLTVLNRLDFSVCTPDDFKDRFTELASMNYPILNNKAFDYAYPIYEQLLHFPADKSALTRQYIHDFIIQNIPSEVLQQFSYTSSDTPKRSCINPKMKQPTV